MSIRDGYFNRGTSRWVDGSGNSQYAEATIPYVTRREKLTFTLNVVETDSDTGVTGPSAAWAGQSLTYRFFVDNDYKNYITGTLNTAITAGPITEIKIDGFGTDTDQILSTGRISLTNTLNESETFSYTGFTESGGVYTFVVSATAAYSYAIGDSARVVEASLIEVDNVDIDSTDDDTGILIITMDANNQAFIDAGDAAAAAEIDGCRFEIQVLDTEPRIIDTIGGEWRCLNLLVDDFATPPPAPGTNYYTKIESDARFLIKSGSSGGQTAYGGTGTGENLFLYSNTSNNGFIGIGQNMSVNEANGRVLIGSGTTAQCALHLYTDSGAICQRIESTDASNGVMQLQLYNDSDKELSLGKLGSTTSVGTFGAGSGAILNRDGDFNVVADSNNPIKFYTDATDSQNLSATEKMRLTAAGTLCINQPSGPTGTELFHVAGDVRLGGASTNRKIFGPTDASLQLIADPNATDEGIRFSVDGTGTATAMFIAENGDVRIGYEAPYSNEEFGVAGDAYIDGQLDVTDDATIDGMYVGSRGATSNTFLGEAAGNSFTGSTSVGIGARAAFNNISGSTWTAVGRDAAYNATGSQWVAAGYQAGYNCTANGWLAAGYRAAYNNVSGNSWVAIGQEAAFNATGSSFISIGYRSAYELQASSNWVAIGYFAGRYQVGGTTALTSAPNSMYLGYQTKGTQGASNEIVIGYTAEGNGSNTVTLGNDSITDTYLKGDVDIEDNAYIYLSGDSSTDGSVRFSYQSGSTAILMEARVSGSWVTKHSFSMA